MLKLDLHQQLQLLLILHNAKTGGFQNGCIHNLRKGILVVLPFYHNSFVDFCCEFLSAEIIKFVRCRLSRNGVIAASCKAKSKKLSATALLTYSEFTFNKTKDAFTVDEAEVKEVFFELRNDVTKMALAQYLCELAYEFCEEDYESEEILRLFLNSLYLLKSDKKTPFFIKAVIMESKGSDCMLTRKELSAFFENSESMPQKNGAVAKITLTFAAFVNSRAIISRKK